MSEPVKSMIAMTEAFPDGQRITGVAIEYADVVSDVSPDAFQVDGRTIIGAYTNTEARPAQEPKPGHFVILRLSPKDAGCETLIRPGGKPKGEKGEPSKGGPPKGGPGKKLSLNSKRKEIVLSVSQIAPITTENGTVLPPFGPRNTEGAYQEIVDEFLQRKVGGMCYNIYIPADYDPREQYPLVMFIPDATGGGDHPSICLEQGNGAINFARERDQKKHPAFVLGIQYGLDAPLTQDDFTVNEEGVRQIMGVLNHVLDTYSIDRSRVYTTGQSMGCMVSCELNIRYPELFAASLLVAGQWDPEKMGRLHEKNFWILVSEHDAKAFPGMNAVTAAMEKNGGKVGRYCWNAKAGKDALNAAVELAAAEDCHLRYTVFEGDSVVPEGTEPGPGSNHMSTWPVVYGIDALRDWLFTQKRSTD